MTAGLSIVTVAFLVLAAGIKLGPVLIGPVTFVIGAGLGSTMPAAQTMVQWAAGEKRLGVGTATVSFSRTIGGVVGAALSSAVLLGALQVADPNARAILSQELASIGSSHVEVSRIAPALIAAYRWMFYALGALSCGAALVAWSIPNLDLAVSPGGALTSSSWDNGPTTATHRGTIEANSAIEAPAGGSIRMPRARPRPGRDRDLDERRPYGEALNAERILFLLKYR